jgi:hypothetical protein
VFVDFNVLFEKVFEDLEDFLGEVLRDFEEVGNLVDLEGELENYPGTELFNLFLQGRLGLVTAEKTLDLPDQLILQPDFLSHQTDLQI